jgi:hypothetical protein
LDLEGKGLEGVKVMMLSGESVMTDKDGWFMFKGLKEGKVTLQFNKTGYVFNSQYQREVNGLLPLW